MSRGLNHNPLSDRRAFTLAEVVVSTTIAIYVILSVWSIFFIGWKWWHEMAPIVEAQSVTRIALSNVIDGSEDSTAGPDQAIGGNHYGFRNGIAWATITNEDPQGFVSPVISDNNHRIEFKLENDNTGVNGRAFYIDTDATTGMQALYYRDNLGAAHKIRGTEINVATGSSIALTFDWNADGYENLIKATVRVEKYIPGTKYESSPLVVEYSDFIYCRNL